MAKSEKAIDNTSFEKENIPARKCTAGGFFNKKISFNSNPTLWDTKLGKEEKTKKQLATVETFNSSIQYWYTAIFATP